MSAPYGPYPPGAPVMQPTLADIANLQVQHFGQMHALIQQDVYNIVQSSHVQLLRRVDTLSHMHNAILENMSKLDDRLGAMQAQAQKAPEVAPPVLMPAQRDALATLLAKRESKDVKKLQEDMMKVLEKITTMDMTLAEVAEHVMDPKAAAPSVVTLERGVNTEAILGEQAFDPTPHRDQDIDFIPQTPRFLTPSFESSQVSESHNAYTLPSPSATHASISAPPESVSASSSRPLLSVSNSLSSRLLKRTDTSTSAILAQQRAQLLETNFDDYARPDTSLPTSPVDEKPLNDRGSEPSSVPEEMFVSLERSCTPAAMQREATPHPSASKPKRSDSMDNTSASTRKRRRIGSPSLHLDLAAVSASGSRLPKLPIIKRMRTSSVKKTSQYPFDWVQCSECSGWLHTQCVGIGHEKAARSSSYRCSFCKSPGKRALLKTRLIPQGTCMRPSCDVTLPTCKPDRIVGRQENDGDFRYLVKWKGYPMRCATWEPSSRVEPLLQAFHHAAREEGHDPDVHFDFFLEEAETANGPWKSQ